MTTLLITLPLPGQDATLVEYLLSSADGCAVSAHASVPLALLPNAHDEVLVLVPAQALSWHQVQLPNGSVPRGWAAERGNNRLRSILDGVLEDQLLDDPAQLHLALQPQAIAGTPVWVAACDRSWLKAGLHNLAQAGYAPGRIVPELTPQALADQVLVLGTPEQPWVAGLQALPDSNAVPDPRAGLLCGPLNAASLAWLGSTSLPVVAEPAVAGVAEVFFKRPVDLLARPQRLLQAARTTWDLAQFDLAHTERDRRRARVTQAFASFWQAPRWRAARWSVLALVLVNLVGLNALAWHAQADLDAQRAALRSVLLQTFPKVPVVVDAALQMAREVAVLQRASGAAAGSDMESMLASFSAVTDEKYNVVAIDFEANELRLKGSSVADAEGLISRLKAAGLRARVQGDQWLLSAGGQP